MRWVAYTLVLLASLPVGLLHAQRERSLDKGRETVAQLERDIKALTREYEDGKAWAAALRTDPAAIESVARDKMGYVREGEWVFRIESEQTAKAEVQK